MNVTETSKATARDILRFINKYPWMHEQDSWYSSDEGEFKVSEEPDEVVIVPTQKDVCNTTLCVAGTAVLLNDGKLGLKIFDQNEASGEARAAQLLGLSNSEASKLFYTMDNDKAKNLLSAVADGDVSKFNDIYITQ